MILDFKIFKRFFAHIAYVDIEFILILINIIINIEFIILMKCVYKRK